MANPLWLDDVRERLADKRLPPKYVRRLLDELSEHLEDLKEENMSTEANAYSRLGEPEQVAQAAIITYRRHSFLGRHPVATFLVFAVSPIVPLVALVVLVGALVWGSVEVCDRTRGTLGAFIGKP